MGKKGRRSATPPRESRRIYWRAVALDAVFLLVGLTLAVAAAVYTTRVSAKADRLRAEGLPVTAAVSDFREGAGRNSRGDTIALTYEYQGELYQKRIHCGGYAACHQNLPSEMAIWVDPAKPEEFVATNGKTDDSSAWLNRPQLIGAGGGFAALGAVLLVIILFGDRLSAWSASRAKRRAAARDGSAAADSGC